MSPTHLTPDQAAEYHRHGKISTPDLIAQGTSNIGYFPENPFDYSGLLARGRIGKIPKDREGTKVAIIGGGVAGLCAAYELMKVGLQPVIFEASDRLGGRTWTKSVPGDEKVALEMGAMRVPTAHETFMFYKDEFDIETTKFPNPGGVDTMLWFEDHRDLWKAGGQPPSYVEAVGKKLMSFFLPKVEDMMVSSPKERVKRWAFWVNRYKDVGFLDALCMEGRWTDSELSVLGAIGGGTGGLDAQFRVTLLEVFRAAIGEWYKDDQLILGGRHGVGIQSLADSFWKNETATARGSMKLMDLQGGGWRSGVAAITPASRGAGVEITDRKGNSEVFSAAILTCTTRALQMGMNVDERLFDVDVWRGIRRIHYMNSSKILCSSESKFWEHEGIAPVTLTDRALRSAYLFDYGPQTKAGSLLLSYTWGDDSTKFLALTKKEQIKICLRELDHLYKGGFSAQKLNNFEVIGWQNEPGYNGAFKLTYPGQYEDNLALYNQHRKTLDDGSDHGLFLAGEGVSWAGGWIEGGLHSGLNAAFSVLRLLGGNLQYP